MPRRLILRRLCPRFPNISVSAGGEFVPAGRQMQIDLAQLKDYESLVGNFYAIDANTMIGSDQ